jgi:cysteine-rich repeat protein
MRGIGYILSAAMVGLGLPASAVGVLVDLRVDGTVFSNAITIGPYAGVAVGTPVRLTVRVDTTSVFSDEPENVTTWYLVDYTQVLLAVDGVPTANGLSESVISNSVVAFSGGDDYYQFDVGQVTILHCQFDGFCCNPFNNTGHIEENLGAYSAAIFDSLQHFRVQVAHPGPVFRDMWLVADTFTVSLATAAVCGNGTTEPGEECDDGNTAGGDGCDVVCDVEPGCGNGRIDPTEECDDGNTANGDGCDSVCRFECGNGTIDPGEECDDSNRISFDGCSSICKIEPGCGNGRVELVEQCDDGNHTNGDGCDSQCRWECGNGSVTAGEICDDGNRLNGDGCDDRCRIEFVCGNGAAETGEQCDDHNVANGDGCDSLCRVEVVCGNGRLEPTEQCDDGDLVSGNGCDGLCKVEFDATLCVEHEGAEVNAPVPQSDGLFGTHIELDGDRLIAGAQGTPYGGVAFSGTAFIHRLIDGVWHPEVELYRPAPEVGENAGGTVALKGHVAAVGAILASTPAGPDAGAVLVYSDRGGEWNFEARLHPSISESSGQTGPWFPSYNEGIAITGDMVLVSADGYSPGGISGGIGLAGAVFVFEYSGGAWVERPRIQAPDARPNARFGESVDADGDVLVVGAAGTSGNAAYIFRRSGAQWVHEKKLTIPPTAFSARFGDSVGVSGDTVVVGSPAWSPSAANGPGSAWVFRRVGAAWVLEAQLQPADGAGVAFGGNFGGSVDIDGDHIVVGAEGYASAVDDDGASGAAYVFRRIGHVWTEVARVTASDPHPSDLLGRSVSISGNLAAVGAEFHDLGNSSGGNEGGVFVFNVAAPLCHPLAGDGDADGDVDLSDWAMFADCLHGPGAAPAPAAPVTAQQCLDAFDANADSDVDLEDAAAFDRLFSR